MEMTERGGFSKPEDRTMKFTQPEQQRGTRLKKKNLEDQWDKKKNSSSGFRKDWRKRGK